MTIDVDSASQLSAIEQVLAVAERKRDEYRQQQSKFTRSDGKEVLLRDLFGRIVKGVNKFKDVGDVIVQYDPTHAALPWAGIRLFLQVSTLLVLQ